MVIKDRVVEMDSANEMRGAFAQALIETQTHSFLSRLADFLKRQNVGAYLVGGFVRDVLLGRDTADIDIAVAADVLQI